MSHFDCSVPCLQDYNIICEMGLPDIDINTVVKLLRESKTSKSPGPDGIRPRILKELATELAAPLTKIFKSSIDLGLVLCWKVAHIVLIFKKGLRKIHPIIDS